MMPLVSVSCITYNHENYIRQALDSFLEQECSFGYEIIIHDDASTDATPDIIREYAEKYPDIIKPMLQSENQYSRGISNISGVYNFPRALGKYIAMCEGDDFWCDPHKLAGQAAYMEAHPDTALCCHAAKTLAMDGAYRSSDEIHPYHETRQLTAAEVISKPVNFPTASMFFRTEYARTLPEWYFNCPVGDIPLQLYMLSKGNVYYDDTVMSVYRMGAGGSWSSGMDDDKAREKWERHYVQMKDLFEAFDRDTMGRYSSAVNDAIRRNRFLIDIKEGSREAVLDPANAAYLGELPDTERRLLKLKAHHPFVYGALQKTYRKFSG